MPGQQRKPHQQQEQIGERDPLMRHVVAETAEARTVLEAGEDQFVDDDRSEAAKRDLKRLVMEQRDPEQRQREQDEVDRYSKHKDRFNHNGLEYRLEIFKNSGKSDGNLHYFSVLSQSAISLTAMLACGSSLPMVK